MFLIRLLLYFSDRKYRVECWDINQRGTVGENILHMCVLLSTAIHADLAKRLIKAYPKLLNDIYLKDEYYGMSEIDKKLLCFN